MEFCYKFFLLFFIVFFSGDLLYAQWIQTSGPGGGIFCSSDNGTSWAPVNSGLTNLYITDFDISASGSGSNNIFAGTYGGGVFLSTNYGTICVGTSLLHAALSFASFSDITGEQYIFARTSGGIYYYY